MDTITFYSPAELRPAPRVLAGVDTTSELGREYAAWTRNNRRTAAEYQRRRRAQIASQKGRGLWHDGEDHGPRRSLPTYDAARITIEIVSIVSGVEVLTVTVNRD
jgi:hypothetical protein